MPLFERIGNIFKSKPVQPVGQFAAARQTHPLTVRLQELNKLSANEFGNGQLFTRFEIPQMQLILNGQPANQKIPGGVLYFPPSSSGVKNVLIGDIHANVPNFRKIISKYEAELAQGRVNLIFLGDLVHPEHGRPLGEMDSTLEIIGEYAEAKLRFRDNIHLLRGDHEDLENPNLRKGVVFQGQELRKHLLSAGGQELYNEVNTFFKSLPYLAIFAGNRGLTLAGHTAIVKGGRNLDQAIAARFEIIPNTEVNPFFVYSPYILTRSELADYLGYRDQDIKAMLEGLFNSEPQMLGMKRKLTESELRAVNIVVGHSRYNGNPLFVVDTMCNPITVMQSYLDAVKVQEVVAGGLGGAVQV